MLKGNYSASQVYLALAEAGADHTLVERLEESLEGGSERFIVDPKERASVVTLRDIATALGKEYNTVMRWADRRETSHFPNPVGRTLSTGRGRHAHAFDREAVRSWLLTKKGLTL